MVSTAGQRNGVNYVWRCCWEPGLAPANCQSQPSASPNAERLTQAAPPIAPMPISMVPHDDYAAVVTAGAEAAEPAALTIRERAVGSDRTFPWKGRQASKEDPPYSGNSGVARPRST